MSEIEAKRKELEYKARILELENETRYADRLEGFNLGVEMARKEILDKIERLPKCYCNAGEECRHFKQLKQSLEDKKV